MSEIIKQIKVTSLQIAEWTGKDHTNILRDMENSDGEEVFTVQEHRENERMI